MQTQENEVEVPQHTNDTFYISLTDYVDHWWDSLATAKLNTTEQYVTYLLTKARIFQNIHDVPETQIVEYLANKFNASFGNARTQTLKFIDRKVCFSLSRQPDVQGLFPLYDTVMNRLVDLRQIGHNSGR